MSFLGRSGTPVPAHLTATCAGKTVHVEVRISARARRYTLRVPAGGAPVLTLPAYFSLRAARTFLDGHQNWLEHELARRPATRFLEPGELLPVRGIEHRLDHRPRSRGTEVVYPPGRRPMIAVAGAEEHFRRRLVDWLKREARGDLDRAVQRYAKMVGIRPAAVKLRDTKSRWGSCSPRRTLSFSWRLIMAPPYVLDYIAAHEVAHLREMNHGPRFWRLVYKLYPQAREAEDWLRLNGQGLYAIAAE